MTFERTLPAPSTRFTVGGVIRRTFGIAGLNFWSFFALSLAVIELPKWGVRSLLVPALAELQRSAAAGGVSPVRAFLEAFALGAAPGFVAQMGAILLTAVVARAALDAVAGHSADVGYGLRTGLTSWPGNVVLTVIFYACFLSGLVLFVVPGLILSCMWAVFLPAHLDEGGSLLACFGRSRALTKGRRWRIFWLTSIYGALAGGMIGFVSGVAKGLATAGVPSGVVAVVQVLAALLGAAIAVVSSSGVTALYLELRGSDGGLPRRDLVEAFS